MQKRLLSVREAAQQLGVSTATMYKLFKAGKLMSVTINRARRVEADELNAFIVRSRQECYGNQAAQHADQT
ncbi:MAG: helix-turn-helix domain-containing protein [Chloroflexaceae bacterium]|nr:helix-turn-helix domain-containing protein [Chloroflexaceae bacterium]